MSKKLIGNEFIEEFNLPNGFKILIDYGFVSSFKYKNSFEFIRLDKFRAKHRRSVIYKFENVISYKIEDNPDFLDKDFWFNYNLKWDESEKFIRFNNDMVFKIEYWENLTIKTSDSSRLSSKFIKMSLFDSENRIISESFDKNPYFNLTYDDYNDSFSKELEKYYSNDFIIDEKREYAELGEFLLGDVIISNNHISQKWLFNIKNDVLYLAPYFRGRNYFFIDINHYSPIVEKIELGHLENFNDFKKKIKKYSQDIKNLIMENYFHNHKSFSLTEKFYININTRYMGNDFRKILFKYENYEEMWFYHITHWDWWFCELTEPFTEFPSKNFFKLTPIKELVFKKQYEIEKEIMDFYNIPRRHALNGEIQLVKCRNRKKYFKLENGLEFIINPDCGEFDYDTYFERCPKYKNNQKSNSVHVTDLKKDIYSECDFESNDKKFSNNIKENDKSKINFSEILNKYSEHILISLVEKNKNLIYKPFNVGTKLKLLKEPDNEFDGEAIAVEIENLGKVAYVANDVHTVIKGTYSAGRIYDKFEDTANAEVICIGENKIIAKLIK